MIPILRLNKFWHAPVTTSRRGGTLNKMRKADDEFFENLVEHADTTATASARLKSRIYSALVKESQKIAPLRVLLQSLKAGCPYAQFHKATTRDGR